ncbi:hypothetical protein V6N13_077479 [Hibiscus sabdariffa]|uniref:Uncharacterized protein n=1 Tax=Hibiscus sabdariffa TaxID=183260 RepID=A0ABR2CP00_9ROSI
MAIEDNQSNKRARVESEDFELEASSVPNSKLPRVYSGNSGSGSPVFTRVEPDPDDEDIRSPEAKCIPEELLSILDDSDPVIEPDPDIHGLDLVIKSFEEEILVPVPAPAPAPIPVTKSDSGESLPELGSLLEASVFSFVEEEQKIANVGAEEGGGLGAVGFAETMAYEFPLPSYELFEFGVGGDSDINSGNNNSDDFVALGGLFDTAADIPELTWRPESLSAS